MFIWKNKYVIIAMKNLEGEKQRRLALPDIKTYHKASIINNSVLWYMNRQTSEREWCSYSRAQVSHSLVKLSVCICCDPAISLLDMCVSLVGNTLHQICLALCLLVTW